ncbi:SDR family oxidoreductase [Pantoea eucrina]|uniref:SDR family oxidoreductase n=1 Tax=Pantoea eucrina TaxID=472693 RepID=A0ABU5LJT5_9GAMM|nr:SDR family oxidoreductase [Pantoea eucrina]MDZ7280192.1 SDR family oxidoreductase [Pantoea eucrina]
MNLLNKNVILTGASDGMGQALARKLADQGACLWLVGRNRSALQALRASLREPGRHTVFCVTEYSDDEIINLAACFHAGLRLDVLINNADTSRFALLAQQSFQDIRLQLRVNSEIPLLLTRALIHHFAAGGVILSVGSVLGELGHPGYSVYGATKASMLGFSDALRRELAPSGLSVIYVAPRRIRTALHAGAAHAMQQAPGQCCDEPEAVADHVMTALLRNQPRSRMGRLERIFIRLNTLFPRLVDYVLQKKMPAIDRLLYSQAKEGFQER